MKKLGLLFDERLSHDRKKVFNRNMTVLKLKYSVDFLPIGFDEESFLKYLKESELDVVMIPWHLYLQWKKAANLSAVKVVGYFADPLLHFEFQTIPNYRNFILLDFYRFDIDEIEILLKLLRAQTEDLELIEVFGKKAHYYKSDWSAKDLGSMTCIDHAFDSQVLKTKEFHNRLSDLRLYLTSLWLACGQEKHSLTNIETLARFVMAEYHQRLLIQLSFTSQSLTTKDILKEIWPTTEHSNVIYRELSLHSDFIKINHFPESRKITITSLFLPKKLTNPHSGEVHGFWIETRL